MCDQDLRLSFYWDELVASVVAEKDDGEYVIDDELGDRLRTMAMECNRDMVIEGLKRVEAAFIKRK